MFKNIFTREAHTTTPVRYETQDFNVTESVLEFMNVMESQSFLITRDHMMVTHLSMKDDNLDILEEGMKDFMDSAAEFFKKLLKKFKEFMSKVFMFINSRIGSFDKFIDKYKDQLNKLNPSFEIKGFEYSLNSSVPNLDEIDKIISTYNTELTGIKDLNKKKLVEDREQYTKSENMDKLRGQVMNQSEGIEQDEFVSELKKHFRSGEDTEQTIQVDKTKLQSAISGYKDLKKLKSEMVKEKDKVILLIESLKNFFNRSASVHYKDNNKTIYTHSIKKNEKGNAVVRDVKEETHHSSEQLEVINIFYNYKWTQAKEVGAIMTLVMTEKVNAVKESLKLHETIIKKALTHNKKEESGDDK